MLMFETRNQRSKFARFSDSYLLLFRAPHSSYYLWSAWWPWRPAGIDQFHYAYYDQQDRPRPSEVPTWIDLVQQENQTKRDQNDRASQAGAVPGWIRGRNAHTQSRSLGA